MSEHRLFKVIRTDESKYFDIEYVRDVVTCGDCKYWNMVSNGCMRNPSVEGWQADDFCSYGEREGE